MAGRGCGNGPTIRCGRTSDRGAKAFGGARSAEMSLGTAGTSACATGRSGTFDGTKDRRDESRHGGHECLRHGGEAERKRSGNFAGRWRRREAGVDSGQGASAPTVAARIGLRIRERSGYFAGHQPMESQRRGGSERGLEPGRALRMTTVTRQAAVALNKTRSARPMRRLVSSERKPMAGGPTKKPK